MMCSAQHRGQNVSNFFAVLSADKNDFEIARGKQSICILFSHTCRDIHIYSLVSFSWSRTPIHVRITSDPIDKCVVLLFSLSLSI